MTDKNLTEIVAIIDKSISMESLVNETLAGFNSFIEEQKKSDGKAKITLVQFNTESQITYNGIDLNDVKPLSKEDYIPSLWTALYDAIGYTINTVGERLANTKEEERPGQVIILIITDGDENSSKKFNLNKINEMIKHQTEVYSWRFVYLGGGDSFLHRNQGSSLGISANNIYNYKPDSYGTSAVYTNVSKGVTRARVALSVDANYTAAAAAAPLLDDSEIKDLTS